MPGFLIIPAMAIYLDHAATSPLRPEVLEAMLPYLIEHTGNPSSLHAAGRRARQGVDEARETIAASSAPDPREVVFTSGGTEADNLALKGARGPPAVAASTSSPPRSSTRRSRRGSCPRAPRVQVTVLPVERSGRVDLARLPRRSRSGRSW